MAMIGESKPSHMTAKQAAQRGSFALWSELSMREKIEEFSRERVPGCRVVHELVIGEGKTRADIAAIGTDHIAAFELKGAGDSTVRLLHQIGVFQLGVPEVWMCVTSKQYEDAELVRYLMPSVGLIRFDNVSHNNWGREPENTEAVMEIVHKPKPFQPHPEVMLRILWRDELAWACNHSRCFSAKSNSTRPTMVRAMLDALEPDEILRLVCAALRGRDALWRADAPIADDGQTVAVQTDLV